jgi:hypothetical protein
MVRMPETEHRPGEGAGAIQNAADSPTRSETMPTIVGEIASPSAWMTKMFTA